MKTIIVVAAVAAASYFVWNHYFSRAAKIERAYAACVSKMEAGMSQAKADLASKVPSGSDPSSAIAKGMTDAMASMMQGMGGAMCSMIKDTCKQDFNGPVCQAAISGSR